MNLYPVRDCLHRVFDQKIILIIYAAVFAVFTVLGICFIKTPAIYYYHCDLCDRFIDRVCFSERNVFVIFLERGAGCLFLLAVSLLAGMNVFALAVPSVLFVYRAYTLGGSIYIFCSVYRMSGVLIALVLYLPIHLLIDAILLAAIALSIRRAPGFCFDKRSFWEMARDFIVLGILIVLICLLEAVLLAALFHPLGTII